MISLDVTPLQYSKNLLAFSSGVDSSALFFLLIEHHISFDIAIVNYGLRDTSEEEVLHAKKLAKQYKCYCHHINAPHFTGNFEKKARDFRYEFFDSLIQIEGYDTLITAHQLNDQLEWLLMRLCRGAGLSELLGLEPITPREGYTLVRPLLDYSKAELLTYLDTHHYPYFVDTSNEDTRYERNFFRQHFSEPLLAHAKEGIQRSLTYLHTDKQLLEENFTLIYVHNDLHILTLHHAKAKVKAADLTLKKLGYLLSAAQRNEIAKEPHCVIGGAWAIALEGKQLYIAPYLTLTLPKNFKEACRLQHIPPKIRPYLFDQEIPLSTLP